MKTETEGEWIRIRGARVHNLRDVDVDIPRNRFVVLTGVSGSGKSTLAFDTIHAEGRRRYVDGLSSHARRFLDQLERPDVDEIEGLPPTVAIDQRSGSANPRSTVATLTEIHDHLRLLYARVGTPHCAGCGGEIRRQSPEQVVSSILSLPDGTKLILLAPLVRGRKGEHREAFDAIRRAGLLRARVDGETIEIQEDPKLAKTKAHRIEAVVDRLVVREGIRPRLAESVDAALRLGDGAIVVSVQEGAEWIDRPSSIHYACPSCGTSLEELEPRTFSFNSPYGACPSCDGLGSIASFEPDAVLRDPGRSLDSGLVAAWEALGPRSRQRESTDPGLEAFLSAFKISRSKPFRAWSSKARDGFLRGTNEYAGVLRRLAELYEATTDSERATLESFRVVRPCASCGGARLRPEARAVLIESTSIDRLCGLSIRSARGFLAQWTPSLEASAIARPILAEVERRLGFLEQVGLGYLTLDRSADTLSGGELQRVRLGSQVGSGLVGVCYVLDEPTAGLHPSDTERLLSTLVELRDRGNSLVVVEHDELTIRRADWLIDLGPGAGIEGGRVVERGFPADVVARGETLTAQYLGREPGSIVPRHRSMPTHWISIKDARANNLRGIDVDFPLGRLICVTGVSGSGKSTLVHEILARACRRVLAGSDPGSTDHGGVIGLERIDKVIEVDQAPLGKGSRSTPATYTGLFDEIRRVYARMRESKIRGFGAGRFSFNAKPGRCERCAGLGVRRIEMGFLPAIEIRCESCNGLRFNPSTLEVKFRGKSIGEVLGMRVDEALEIFENVPRVKRGLESLREAGLGYVALGQSSTTLSGGESQRVKLAAELGKAATGNTLYILDEPTTGLHFADTERLLALLDRLVDLGNTVLVIEHALEVIRRADWVIDLGPGGGEEGGELIASGPPEAIREVERSLTGRWI
ncbi:MAG: excinuclease ABC subunit UvrA [Isosphaeraceae bacterium]|nr:excinuclease ABC subunit UvrA [Isosphaeraceae bacterium]